LWVLAILVVGDHFHPFDDLAVEIFLNGDMRHGGGWRRAMPMLLARREPDHIAGMNLFNRTGLALRLAAAGCDNQGLTERMCVPRGASTWQSGPQHPRESSRCAVRSHDPRVKLISMPGFEQGDLMLPQPVRSNSSHYRLRHWKAIPARNQVEWDYSYSERRSRIFSGSWWRSRIA